MTYAKKTENFLENPEIPEIPESLDSPEIPAGPGREAPQVNSKKETGAKRHRKQQRRKKR